MSEASTELDKLIRRVINDVKHEILTEDDVSLQHCVQRMMLASFEGLDGYQRLLRVIALTAEADSREATIPASDLMGFLPTTTGETLTGSQMNENVLAGLISFIINRDEPWIVGQINAYLSNKAAERVARDAEDERRKI